MFWFCFTLLSNVCCKFMVIRRRFVKVVQVKIIGRHPNCRWRKNTAGNSFQCIGMRVLWSPKRTPCYSRLVFWVVVGPREKSPLRLPKDVLRNDAQHFLPVRVLTFMIQLQSRSLSFRVARPLTEPSTLINAENLRNDFRLARVEELKRIGCLVKLNVSWLQISIDSRRCVGLLAITRCRF